MLEDVSSGVDVHAAAKVVGEHVVVEPAAEVLCARRAADWSGHVKGFCNSSLFMLWCSGGGSRESSTSRRARVRMSRSSFYMYV